jgi:hypothetical protein
MGWKVDWEGVKGVYHAIGFSPLPKQEEVLKSEYPYNLFVGGVGAGKSLTAAMYAAPRFCLRSTVPRIKKARYWIVGENYELPRAEFTYIRDSLTEWGVPLTNVSEPRDGRWQMEVEGISTIETKSWTNPESLHSVPVQGMLVVEAGLLPHDIWHLRLVGRLTRVPGAWCMWSGTLEEAGSFYKEMVRRVVIDKDEPDWFGVSMATWENVAIYPGGLEDPVIEDLRRTTPEDIFQERYGATPRQVAALVYREFTHKWHVYAREAWWDENRPVYVFVDPGGVYAVNAVQRVGDDVNVIDEIHAEHWTSPDVIREAVGRPWWDNVEFVVMDSQTYDEAKLSWQGGFHWERLDAQPKPVRWQKVGLDDGIEAVRRKLHSGDFDVAETKPETVWDFHGKPGVARLHIAAHCKNTIFEFSEGYKRKKVRSGEYSPDEVVDRDNHHCAAIAYGLVNMFGVAKRPAKSKVFVPWVESRPMTWW